MQPLRFYQAVLAFQHDLASDLKITVDPSRPLRSQIDLDFAYSKIPALLALVREQGPENLRRRSLWGQDSKNGWEYQLKAMLTGEPRDLDPVESFFPRACLQPMAERLQVQMSVDVNSAENICPMCDGLPQGTVLRPEGDGASRWLFCSFCLHEWLYRRIVCPWCGEENKERLPRYSCKECPHVHIEACDTCKRYLKAVDTTVDGHADALVDEAAFAALDLWAVEHEYRKLVPNLTGF